MANKRSKFDQTISDLIKINSEILENTSSIKDGLGGAIRDAKKKADKVDKPAVESPKTEPARKPKDNPQLESINAKMEHLNSLSSASIGAQRDGIRDLKTIGKEIESSTELSSKEKEELLGSVNEQKEILTKQTSIFNGMGEKIVGAVDKVSSGVSFALGGSPLAMMVSSFITGQVKEFLERRKARKAEKLARKDALKTNRILSKIKKALQIRPTTKAQLQGSNGSNRGASRIRKTKDDAPKKGGFFRFLLLAFVGVFGLILKFAGKFGKGLMFIYSGIKGVFGAFGKAITFVAGKLKWMWTVVKEGLTKLLTTLGLGKVLNKGGKDSPTKKGDKDKPKARKPQPRDAKGRFIKADQVPNKAKASVAKKVAVKTGVKTAAKIGLRFVPFLGWAYTAADLAALAFTGGQKDLFDLAEELSGSSESPQIDSAKDMKRVEIEKARSSQLGAMQSSKGELSAAKRNRENMLAAPQTIVQSGSGVAAQQNISNIMSVKLNPKNNDDSFHQANLAGAM